MSDTNKVSNDQGIQDIMDEQAKGNTSNIPQLDPTLPTVKEGETEDTTNKLLDNTNTGGGTSTVDTKGLTADLPEAPPSGVGQVEDTTKIAPDITGLGAEQMGPAPQIDIDKIQGTVSEGSQAVAATQELDERATIQYQLEQLLGGIQEGKPMPPWASPAMRKISGVMQARGLGGSSMAAAAMTQAVMESGITIAAQDANKYATIQLQNLNNEQKTALQNAAVVAGMDKANLSARLQGAVTNAQMLLSTETKNLDARQQSAVLSYNAKVQAMFKDAAEDNARKQFNAKNELQVEEFFAELSSQVETANLNRIAATEQFNAGEINAQTQFNMSFRDSREKFNSQMQYAVDQSNVQWRRQVNTAATAVQNETNRINVANAFNTTQNAQNNLWQKYRDNAAWNFSKSESFVQRIHELGIMAMEFANTKEMYTKQQRDNLAMQIGDWVTTWIGNSLAPGTDTPSE